VELVAEGADLSEIRVSQHPDLTPPLFIPSATSRSKSVLDLSWAAVDLEELLTVPKGKPSNLSGALASSEFRRVLKIQDETRLIAVLNGQDEVLEGFWGMKPNRALLYNALSDRGFTIVTGPTFSVIDETSGFPAPHNIVMLRRHNQVLSEIGAWGFVAAPNIYWRNERTRERWASWLRTHSVRFVARDFSRAKQDEWYEVEWGNLLSLLQNVGRPLHIFLTGVGRSRGPRAIRDLTRLGHSVSIVSSFPIRLGIGGRRITFTEGPVNIARDSSMSLQELVLSNLATVERYFWEVGKEAGASNAV
jgi:hypothetical protein